MQLRHSSLVFGLVVSLTPTVVDAGIIFQHTGNSDPATEGWSSGFGTGVSAGPISDDLGLGVDSWFVEDTSTSGGSTGGYTQTPTATQIAQASTLGWELSVAVRVVTGTVGTFDSMFINYIDGSTGMGMNFDTDPDGDPVVLLPTDFVGNGLSYTLEGVGNTSYHTYSLRYDPVVGTADLFVDGVERLSDYAGVPLALQSVGWGAGASDGTGRVHFSSATWSIAPEPSSLALLSMGALGMAGYGWRRKRKTRQVA